MLGPSCVPRRSCRGCFSDRDSSGSHCQRPSYSVASPALFPLRWRQRHLLRSGRHRVQAGSRVSSTERGSGPGSLSAIECRTRDCPGHQGVWSLLTAHAAGVRIVLRPPGHSLGSPRRQALCRRGPGRPSQPGWPSDSAHLAGRTPDLPPSWSRRSLPRLQGRHWPELTQTAAGRAEGLQGRSFPRQVHAARPALPRAQSTAGSGELATVL